MRTVVFNALGGAFFGVRTRGLHLAHVCLKKIDEFFAI